ncbi:MAG: hypothetical protein HY376_02025 [Candidatus Blackburnbacteria bacterium]|nr:hypothetical protein [Candidatus Blackburnbacteria bacterium]
MKIQKGDTVRFKNNFLSNNRDVSFSLLKSINQGTIPNKFIVLCFANKTHCVSLSNIQYFCAEKTTGVVLRATEYYQVINGTVYPFPRPDFAYPIESLELISQPHNNEHISNIAMVEIE